MTTDIKTKTFNSTLLLGGATMGLRVVSMVSSIYLLRLLDPVDFGVVSLAYILLSTTNLFSGLGMGAAVIHSPEDRHAVSFHAFVATAVTGTVLFFVVILNAGLFAHLLGNPSIVPVLQWMSALVLLGGLTVIPQSLLEKELMFGRVSTMLIVEELSYIVVALTMAFHGYGLWSLVVASLVKGVVTMGLSWFLFPGWEWLKPLPWDRKLFRRLLNYGMRAAGGGVVSYFYSVTDNFMVGRYLGAEALGFYAKAYDFTTRTVDAVNNVIGVVLFPSYAKIQHERDRLSRAYLKSLRVISLFTVPMSMGIFITAPELVSTLVGAKWLPMVAPLQILAFMSLIKPLSASTAALFSSTGHPGFNMRAGIVVIVVLVASILLLFSYGITGVAFAVVIAHTFGFAFNVYQVHRILEKTAMRMFTAIGPACIGTAGMLAAVELAKGPLQQLSDSGSAILSLVLMVVVGVVVYGGIVLAIQKPLVSELFGIAVARYRSRTA